jgi:hypothetical protein
MLVTEITKEECYKVVKYLTLKIPLMTDGDEDRGADSSLKYFERTFHPFR